MSRIVNCVVLKREAEGLDQVFLDAGFEYISTGNLPGYFIKIFH